MTVFRHGKNTVQRSHGILLVILAAAVVVGLVSAVWFTSADATDSAPSDSRLPVRAAFYYPWYPEHWREIPHYDAAMDKYDSGDPLLIANHIAQMQYAHLDAGIASWWGQGSLEDQRVAELLAVAERTGFKWTLYYEPEFYNYLSTSQIRADLDYIEELYATSPGFLRVEGKPVLFVFMGNDDGCAAIERWRQANADRFYLNFRAPFARIPDACATSVDRWHVYDPSQYWWRLPGHSTTITPGFWPGNQDAPILKRNLLAWDWLAAATKIVNEPWQLVTTWNEWPEATAIEPDTTHGFDFILSLNKWWAHPDESP